jgi:hypothetical protein
MALGFNSIYCPGRRGITFIEPFQCIRDLQCTEVSTEGLNHFTHPIKNHSSCHFVRRHLWCLGRAVITGLRKSSRQIFMHLKQRRLLNATANGHHCPSLTLNTYYLRWERRVCWKWIISCLVLEHDYNKSSPFANFATPDSTWSPSVFHLNNTVKKHLGLRGRGRRLSSPKPSSPAPGLIQPPI